MWRAFFLALGVSLTVLGLECMVVDEAVIVRRAPTVSQKSFFSSPSTGVSRKTVKPPEWAPWTFLSSGIVVLLYSFTIPQRLSG